MGLSMDRKQILLSDSNVYFQKLRMLHWFSMYYGQPVLAIKPLTLEPCHLHYFLTIFRTQVYPLTPPQSSFRSPDNNSSSSFFGSDRQFTKGTLSPQHNQTRNEDCWQTKYDGRRVYPCQVRKSTIPNCTTLLRKKAAAI